VIGIRFAVEDALEDHLRAFADGMNRNFGVGMTTRLVPRAAVVLVIEVSSVGVGAARHRKMVSIGR